MSNHSEDGAFKLDPEFFPDPTNFPGAATRKLSPNDVWALAEPCGPRGVVTPHFGLVEDKVTSISKSGVRICGQDFTSPYLVPWTTGGKALPNNLFIRYDRALAARGVLREAELLLEHVDGVREVVAVCHRDVEVADRSSAAEFRRIYRTLVRSISSELEFQEDQYRRLEGHGAALDEFYHPVPMDGPDEIPIKTPWKGDPDDVGQDPQRDDGRQDDALTALQDGRTDESVDSATAKRLEVRRAPETAIDADTVAGMLGGSEEARPPVDPDHHPKRQRRSR